MLDEEPRPTDGPPPGDRPGVRLAAEVEPWATILKHVIKPTPDPSTWIFPTRAVPPPEMAGKWVAWSADMQTIVASGDTFHEAVERAGDEVVSYQFVPPR